MPGGGPNVRIGIMGCGALGSKIALATAAMDDIASVTVYDIDPDASATIQGTPGIDVASDPEALLAASDLVVEAANKGVVQTTVRQALQEGKSVLILTVGALADDELKDELVALARASGAKIHVPSGAIMGLDGLRAAACADLKAVTLVTTKPLAGLDQDVDKWTLLFNGPARDAVAAFPKNVNVAASLSLAGLGFDDTWVQVAVDPLASRNSHKVILEGDFGRARIEVENRASPDNPRSSRLAALSAIALIKRLADPLQIGS